MYSFSTDTSTSEEREAAFLFLRFFIGLWFTPQFNTLRLLCAHGTFRSRLGLNRSQNLHKHASMHYKHIRLLLTQFEGCTGLSSPIFMRFTGL